MRRIRVSSQCLKRAVRQRLQDDQACETAVRTKRLPAQIAEKLARSANRTGQTTQTAAVAALALMHTAGFSPGQRIRESAANMITFCPAENTADRLAANSRTFMPSTCCLQSSDTAADNLDD